MQRNILVVASNIQVRSRLGKSLRGRGYKATLCGSGAEAIKFAQTITLDTCVIDTQLPDMTAAQLKKQIVTHRPECRIVTLTNFERISSTPDVLKFGPDHFVLSIDQVLDVVGAEPKETEAGPSSAAHLGNEALLSTIDVLIGLLELDDSNFAGSSHQVSVLARKVAEHLMEDLQSVQEVVLGALLRDVGRIGLTDSLRNSAGKFSEEERDEMRSHVDSSLRLFEHILYPWKVLPVVRHHHERYDGSGYPDGLRGREIPIGARILAVVDAYVAMTSPRNYRDAMEPDLAVQELMRQSGHQFDPEVVEVLQRVLNETLQFQHSQKNPKILLIDEDEDFRNLFRLQLANEGCEVVDFPEYDRALEKILKDPPQLIVADVEEGSCAGFDFLLELREDPTLQRIPFVFMSRSNDRIVRMRALREGVDDFLDKSRDLEELVARVVNVLIREAVRQERAVRRERKGITGELENLSLPDIIQMVVVGMKTACVTLSNKSKRGKIWFDRGGPRRAETGKLRGEEAFFELVTWNQGEFCVEHGVVCKKQNLEGDAMFLLMEGLRQLDEKAASAV